MNILDVLKRDRKQYGYIRPVWSPKDFIFGDGQLIDEVLRPDGQWGDFLSAFEPQMQYGWDSMNCWNFSTQKAIKTIGIYKGFFTNTTDYSERYICVLAGGTPNGGMPSSACYAIWKYGLIPEASLPWSSNINSWQEWCNPKPMTKKYLDEGKKWLQEYDFGYDYVKTTYGKWIWRVIKGFFTGNRMSAYQQEMIKDALRYSPLGVSVCAWKQRNGLMYKNSWDRDNHWVQLYGYVEGKYWLIYDNYNDCYVKAEWSYPFGFIMRFSLKKKKMKTIKLKKDPSNLDNPERAKVYAISPDGKSIIWIQGEASYNDLINAGFIEPCTEVDSIDGYTVMFGHLTIGA